ncbi:MAG TPA: hypothetical protein PLP75_12685 [Burkholderiales bacterium]|nr:hypothetical protein [Burkholderiales bacterium]
MKIKTILTSLFVSSILMGCNNGTSGQAPNSSSTVNGVNKQMSAGNKSLGMYNPNDQYAIVFGSGYAGTAIAGYGAFVIFGDGAEVLVSLVEGVLVNTSAILVGGVATAADGIYHAIYNTLVRHDGYQHVNDISVGPQMENTSFPLLITAGGYNNDSPAGQDPSILHQLDGNSWSGVSTLNNEEIIQTSVAWDRTIDYANSSGLNLAQVTPYMVVVTKYGQVNYYDPSRGQWFYLMDESHRGNIDYLQYGRELGNTVTAMSVLWPSTGGDPRVVLGTDNNDSNGAEVYYYNGHSWTNFGIKTHAGDWGRHNAVNQLSVSWNRYGYETPDTSAPYIVAGTNYGEVKYYDPTRSAWFDLINDGNKGNIEHVANNRSIEDNEIGTMSVNWEYSGDPQIVLGTSNSGKNGADVYYYNGHVWSNLGISTHNGDWGSGNAVTALQVAWCGDACTPRIAAGTNYAEVKYYDPARSAWSDLVRDDNKGDIENVANGKSIHGNAILDLQAYWPTSGDPQVVIGTNNSDANGAEVYYYDGHIWTNFGIKTHSGDWGSGNAVTAMRVYWPLNDDLTPKGTGTPYIIAGTNYGEIKVFDPTLNQWSQSTIFH